ncbi:hypothetical protein Tco_1081829 [Tanacetum coccineum]|uniref:Uncharacterized protein n=1 Tax=Tanacetum coccineum TaxID=301880 RepID=A0ABQ5HZY4_9ASTR
MRSRVSFNRSTIGYRQGTLRVCITKPLVPALAHKDLFRTIEWSGIFLVLQIFRLTDKASSRRSTIQKSSFDIHLVDDHFLDRTEMWNCNDVIQRMIFGLSSEMICEWVPLQFLMLDWMICNVDVDDETLVDGALEIVVDKDVLVAIASAHRTWVLSEMIIIVPVLLFFTVYDYVFQQRRFVEEFSEQTFDEICQHLHSIQTSLG